MSTLAEGHNLELSSVEKDAGDKTIVFVKLTDAALKSIEECVPNKNIAVSKPVVQFHSSNGILKLSNKGKANKSYGFTLSYVEGDSSQGSFECLRHRNIESLESIGAMLLKMQINAKEDTYEKTRVKMAAAEVESKKFCTKEIDPSGSCLGKKIKVKRPVVSILPKLCSPLYKTEKITSRPATEICSGLGNKICLDDEISDDKISDSPKENVGKKMLDLKKDVPISQEFFYHMDQSDFMLPEKRNIDSESGTPHVKKLRSAEKVINSKFISNVGVEIDDRMSLKKETNFFLNENTEHPGQCAKKSPKETDSFTNEINEDTCSDGKFNFEEQDILSSYKNGVCFSSLKSLSENDKYSCFGNLEMQSENMVSGNFEENFGEVRSDQIDELVFQHSPSSSIDSPAYEGDIDISEDFFYPPDYAKLYVKITSQDQRECYKSDFDADYEQYKVLHSLVKQAAVKFSAFEDQLKCYKPGSEQHMRIKEQIYQEYFINTNDQVYQDAYKKLHYLHRKLSHIKKLVLTYDEAACDEL